MANFFSLFYLGCFIVTSISTNNNNINNNKRKSPFSLPSPFSFLTRVFSNHPQRPCSNSNIHSTTSFPSSPRSSVTTPIINRPDNYPPRKRRSGSRSDFPVLPLRNDAIPCLSCGEIFQNPNLLEHHNSTKHAVSELPDGDSGRNVVSIIFKSGWAGPNLGLNIHRILKIHISPKILSRFEDYRETVKAKAARGGHVRCVADGNELLRFHCTTLVCNLGQNGNSGLCNHQYCSACGIIRVGFSPKLDGIATLSTSWRAHVAIPDGVEAEFAFMNMKRAMLVCRVIAGRVACRPVVTGKDQDPGFDSLVIRTGSGVGNVDDGELLVFNPKAVLPCFLIVYSI